MYCHDHREPDHVNVRSTKCMSEGCRKQPIFGLEQNRPLSCKEHVIDGYKDVIHQLCLHADCGIRPNYGIEKGKPLYCKKHSDPAEHHDVMKLECLHPNCRKRPSQGTENKKPLYCGPHAPYGYKNVVTPRCLQNGCETLPIFGEKNGKAMYCRPHSTPGLHVDVKHKLCMHEACIVRATFGVDKGKPLYCRPHAPDGYDDVSNKQCLQKGCRKQPGYGVPGKPAEYCQAHAPPGYDDVNNKTCAHDGCGTRCCYGAPGSPSTHCVEHKEPGMLRVKHRTCQQSRECREVPLYGIVHASHCEDHKLSTHVNLVEQLCTDCGLLQVLDAEQRCMYCKPGSLDRARLAKQREIEGFLKSREELSDYVLTDRRIQVAESGSVGCTTKTRPDFIWDYGTHCVILEVDEHQHGNYLEECDCARMININEDIMRRCIFIRYNPDGFKSKGRKQNPNWSTRTDLLAKWLKKAKARKDGSVLEIVRLYFDDFSVSTTTFEKIR
jgi:hypothetical protein